MPPECPDLAALNRYFDSTSLRQESQAVSVLEGRVPKGRGILIGKKDPGYDALALS